MAAHLNSLVVVCPADTKAGLLALVHGLGLDGGMSVALSATGAAPASHYGAHAWATDAFVGIMTGAIVPDVPGVTPEQIAAILGAVTVSARLADQTSPRAHFADVLAGLSLQRIAI